MTRASESVSGGSSIAAAKPAWSTRVASFTTRTLLVLAGLGLLAGFFMPWVSLEAMRLSGFALVINSGQAIDALAGGNSALLIAIPILAVALIASALFMPRLSIWLGLITGSAIILYGIITLMRFFLGMTGAGMWLTVAASLLALVVGLIASGRSSRR